MNHYPHHIGDFDSATRHLTRTERSLYRDLLDLYYAAESPLSPDIERLARRVIAVTPEERQALTVVLDEFFVLQDDGYHNARCDEEIARYRSQIEQATRAGRASAERRNGKKTDTAEQDGNGRSTDAQRASNGRSTGVQRASNQPEPEPEPEPEEDLQSSQMGSGAQARGDDDQPKTPAEWVEVFQTDHGVLVDHRSVHDRGKFWPLAKAWTNAGVTVGQMRRACAKAQAEATEPIAYLPAYVDRVLASMAIERAPPTEPQWRRENRERVQQAVPGIAAQAPGPDFIDVEAKHVPASTLG